MIFSLPPIFIVEIRDNGYVKFTLGTNYFGGKQEGGPKACFFFSLFPATLIPTKHSLARLVASKLLR